MDACVQWDMGLCGMMFLRVTRVRWKYEYFSTNENDQIDRGYFSAVCELEKNTLGVMMFFLNCNILLLFLDYGLDYSSTDSENIHTKITKNY
jgi:hypothetical protein